MHGIFSRPTLPCIAFFSPPPPPSPAFNYWLASPHYPLLFFADPPVSLLINFFTPPTFNLFFSTPSHTLACWYSAELLHLNMVQLGLGPPKWNNKWWKFDWTPGIEISSRNFLDAPQCIRRFNLELVQSTWIGFEHLIASSGPQQAHKLLWSLTMSIIAPAKSFEVW